MSSQQELTVDALVEACADTGLDAGLRYRAELEPVAGAGTPVKPAIYAGAKYQGDRRWIARDGEMVAVDAFVIDNVPSQANRLEAALELVADEVGLPRITIDFSDLHLPAHLPASISSFRLPHRNADAYLRDSVLDGEPFPRHSIGEAIFAATPASPEALYQWMPQALLFGFWQSHLGKKRQQTKLARSWTSEIVGLEPASDGVVQFGLKGDPYNLSIDSALSYDDDDLLAWEVGSDKKKGRKSKDTLGEIGHGQVPVGGEAPAPVAFRRIAQTSVVSFAGLRRIGGSTPQAAAAGRGLLVALGLLAHTLAFGRSFALRSGADLRANASSWSWLGAESDVDLGPLSAEQAKDLLSDAVERAAAEGLPVDDWQQIVLEPSPALRKVMGESYPDLDEDES